MLSKEIPSQEMVSDEMVSFPRTTHSGRDPEGQMSEEMGAGLQEVPGMGEKHKEKPLFSFTQRGQVGRSGHGRAQQEMTQFTASELSIALFPSSEVRSRELTSQFGCQFPGTEF